MNITRIFHKLTRDLQNMVCSYFPLLHCNESFIFVFWSLRRTEENTAVSCYHRILPQDNLSLKGFLWTVFVAVLSLSDKCSQTALFPAASFHNAELLLYLHSYHSASCCVHVCALLKPTQNGQKVLPTHKKTFYRSSAASKQRTLNMRLTGFPAPSEINSKLPWPRVRSPPCWKKISPLVWNHFPRSRVYCDGTWGKGLKLKLNILNIIEYNEKSFHNKGREALEQVGKRDGGCPILGYTQCQAGRV